MEHVIPEGKIHGFKVEYWTVDERDLKLFQIRDALNQTREYEGLKAKKYVRLMRNEQILMSNTPMEIKSSEDFMNKAHGDVLVAGLGLGLVILGIQDKKSLNTLTVVEKYQEVIDLIVSYLPLSEKVKIIKDDIFAYSPSKSNSFNVIYFDIWNSISSENLKEMTHLKNRFSAFLNKEDREAWMGCWRENDCRALI